MTWLSDLLPLIIFACCIAVVLLGRARGKQMYAQTLRDVRAEGHAEGKAMAVSELSAQMGVTVVAGNTVGQPVNGEAVLPDLSVPAVPTAVLPHGRVANPNVPRLPAGAAAAPLSEDVIAHRLHEMGLDDYEAQSAAQDAMARILRGDLEPSNLDDDA